ncbi:hypothetical protein CRV03_03560 [Arcobacter sp. F155]|uniref:hypothetical protein n=1 Tax=Arcobacter sp. F155 TaxID=2044512 RepID=UPI00100B6652|nr:hypothetical protein [Arcobacter sp. F155]RXJ78059.1 hypothetical protein CRV03_03560 [Arcobacter sp. F155]
MQRPKKITRDIVKKAIAKIKRRKGIDGDKDIFITMIAKEAGCSRQYLYKDEFKDIVGKYKKKSSYNETKKGTLAYYKEISEKKNSEIKSLKDKLNKALSNLVDQEILFKALNNLEEENKRLNNSSLIIENERLRIENKELRKKIFLKLI